MDLTDLLRILWRRKLVVAVVAAINIAGALAVIALATPQYESSATLAVRPVGESDFFLFSTIDTIIPVYADAALSRTTKDAALQRAGHEIGDVSVETDRGTPLLEVKVRDPDPLRAQESAQAVTDVLLARSDSGEIGIGALELVQIDRANVPDDPVFPNVALTLLVGGLLGVLLGAVAAVLAENLSTRVDSVEGVEALLGVPCYAEIPVEPRLEQGLPLGGIHGDSGLALVQEALRDLRTNLRLGESTFSVVLITSAAGSDGKTTVSLGLAGALAEAGRQVVLIDGDLRRGRIAEAAGIGPGQGLFEALEGTPLADVVRSTHVPNLSVLSRGWVREDLGGGALRKFPDVLRQASELFDVAVVDSTPLIPVNDARVLAPHCEFVVLVVNARTAQRRQLREAAKRLELLAISPTAFVLNKSKRRPGMDAYYATVAAVPGDRQPTALT